MKTPNLILSVALVITMMSCKSSIETPKPPVPLTKCKVALVEHLYTNDNKAVSDKYFYSYDNDSRVTRIDYGKQQSNEFETFTYTVGKVN
jgi:hypothetical protein